MNAKEFRIGNLLIDREGRICEVTKLQKDESNDGWELKVSAIDYPITSLPIKPIPLTEEWLLKFGFEKYDDCGELKGNDCFYGIKKTGIVIGLTPKFNLSGYRPAKRIQYVHQLQNLYFALTGEELVLKN